MTFACSARHIDHSAARAAQRLVGGGRDDVGVCERARVAAAGNEAGEVGEVDEVDGAGLPGDLAEGLEVDGARVGGSSGNDQAGPIAQHRVAHHVEVDAAVRFAHAVGSDLEEAAAEVDGRAVGEVAAVAEVHPHDGVAGIQEGEVGGHVGLGAGVGLHVGVIGAEQLGRAGAGELLDLVGVLAAAVVPLPGQAFGVLVREHRPHGLAHRRGHEVLAGDHLELAVLAGRLAEHRAVDQWVRTLEVYHSLSPQAVRDRPMTSRRISLVPS